MNQQRPSWQQVTETFLGFFRERGHTVVPSSSLVPAGDPTLLFTNAGMVQFKDAFLGLERRPYLRAATLQRCMRVQGKHNDLENVGPSPRHHTFFLMLGNFSFGDYFKRDAVRFAWELMTRAYDIDPDRLVMTVFQDDDEAFEAWRAVGVPPDRILRMGEATNFWMMADVGPCGPTSELHYDWGPEHCSCGRPDCSVALDNGCLRWLEVWNLVFMQYDQHPDGTRVPLPQPGVDTGMGLERLTSILQGVNDDYGTDLFVPLMDRIQRILGHPDGHRREQQVAYRVMADHGRAMTFLLADGVVPGNEGRGYVLRMIMRRAMRFGRATGTTTPFLGELAGAVVDEMGGVYPELRAQRAFIEAAARGEEERFTQTLTSGLERLGSLIEQTTRAGRSVLPGEEVFRLYDTFGFPVEMTRDVARERGLEVDDAGFARAMEAQRERARAAGAFAPSADDRRYTALVSEGLTTEFVGYAKTTVRTRVTALFVRGERAERGEAGDEVEVILERTSFYPEGGGQVGDTGTLTASTRTVEVRDTRRVPGGLILHLGVVREGSVRVGQPVRAVIDTARRLDIMRNHTATHLLHKALRETLGEQAKQAGSLVAPDRLRFDFIHLASLTPEQRETIEARVNAKILDDLPVRSRWLSYQDAVAQGAMALFGEKYGDRVRMIAVDDYSRELCGGTHLARTGQIGLFKITAEGAVAAGVRRIEAVTGRGALALVARQEAALRAAAEQLRSAPEEVPDRLRRLAEQVKELERRLRAGEGPGEPHDEIVARGIDAAVTVDGIRVVLLEVKTPEPDALRRYADHLRTAFDARREPAVIVLASTSSGRLVASRTRANPPAVDAGAFLRSLAAAFGGSGGGRADLAQGGLRDPGRVRELLERGRDRAFLAAHLSKAT
ncbi:MAG TPA: alanine--tRNA ligase [bacterium]|nr:alanine--tRNA ligase [bacterium]